MAVRVGINGFGRMGRLALRAAWNFPELEFVHINEPGGPVESAAHLLEFDSVHRRWDHDVSVADGKMVIDGKAIGYSSSRTVDGATWRDAGVDIVLESSGKLKTVAELSPFLAAGVKKVIVAAPVKGGDTLNIVMGVNDHLYDPAVHHIVTAASCTTNCLAPVVKVDSRGDRHRPRHRSPPSTARPTRRACTTRCTRTCAGRAPRACRWCRRRPARRRRSR